MENVRKPVQVIRLFLKESFSPRGRLRLAKALQEKEILYDESLKKKIF